MTSTKRPTIHDRVKARAYERAVERHPNRHRSPMEWSRFLFDMAESMSPEHPDYALFMESASLHARTAHELEAVR